MAHPLSNLAAGYSAPSTVERLLEVADGFGEVQVIYDVALRAGLVWRCPSPGCGRPHTERAECCEDCGTPRPNPRPLAEWQCLCGAVTVHPVCACGRSREHFRSAQLYR